MFNAKILADSIAPHGARLTTFEVTYPLIVHNELMTHRDFSRNAASSRAIPVKRMIEVVMNDPFIPSRWPINQKGMQAAEFYVDGSEGARYAEGVWLAARDSAVESVRKLVGEYKLLSESGKTYSNFLEPNTHNPRADGVVLNVYKQIANRLLGPWMWITVVISATRYSNFFALRCHPDAQPEIRTIAEMMRDLYDASTPRDYVAWHTPYLEPEDFPAINGFACGYDRDAVRIMMMVSSARCARTSYLTHPTDDSPMRRPSVEEDVALATRLVNAGHWSPFEHPATLAKTPDERSGNFVGWRQFRKDFAGECR